MDTARISRFSRCAASKSTSRSRRRIQHWRGGDWRNRERTSVERARSFRGVMCYAGKKYLGKEVTLPPGWENVGRFWGACGRKSFPRSRVLDFTMTKAGLHRFRRLVRRYMASKGKVWRSQNGVNLFTHEHLQCARAMDWAETGEIHPFDHHLPLIRQPF